MTSCNFFAGLVLLAAISSTSLAVRPLPDALLTHHAIAVVRFDFDEQTIPSVESALAYLFQDYFALGYDKKIDAIAKDCGRFHDVGIRSLTFVFYSQRSDAEHPIGWQPGVVMVVTCSPAAVEEKLTEEAKRIYHLILGDGDLKIARQGNQLILSDKRSLWIGTPCEACADRFREAIESVGGADISLAFIPDKRYVDHPQAMIEAIMFVPGSSSGFPELLLTLLQLHRGFWKDHEETMADVEWFSSGLQLGIPPRLRVEVLTRDHDTRKQFKKTFDELNERIVLFEVTRIRGATYAGVVFETDANPRMDDHLRLVITPTPFVVLAVPGTDADRTTPQWKSHLAFGHSREVVVEREEGRYRVLLWSAPDSRAEVPRYYSRLLVIQEPQPFKTPTPVSRQALPLAYWQSGMIHVPFAVGSVRYDPVADEILLIERTDLGDKKMLLNKRYGIVWQRGEFEGVTKRFSVEGKVDVVLQSDEKLLTWDFRKATSQQDESRTRQRRHFGSIVRPRRSNR